MSTRALRNRREIRYTPIGNDDWSGQLEFLSHLQIREAASEITEAFSHLMADRTAVAKPDARQWCLLRACMSALIPSSSDSPSGTLRETEALAILNSASVQQLAQYRYEVSRSLDHFYRRYGRAQAYMFQVVHSRTARRAGWCLQSYPDFRNYTLMVRCGESVEAPGVQLAEHAESLIGRALEAEFQAYYRLPARADHELDRYFVQDGPAWRRIVHVLDGCGRRGWTLREPAANPSTYRLVSARAGWERVTSTTTELRVRSTEYWYLRWWDAAKQAYAYPYRETNQQIYFLTQCSDGWRIDDNSYPAPRTSAPHRRRR